MDMTPPGGLERLLPLRAIGRVTPHVQAPALGVVRVRSGVVSRGHERLSHTCHYVRMGERCAVPR